jgi:hypothetical protein
MSAPGAALLTGLHWEGSAAFSAGFRCAPGGGSDGGIGDFQRRPLAGRLGPS